MWRSCYTAVIRPGVYSILNDSWPIQQTNLSLHSTSEVRLFYRALRRTKIHPMKLFSARREDCEVRAGPRGQGKDGKIGPFLSNKSFRRAGVTLYFGNSAVLFVN